MRGLLTSVGLRPVELQGQVAVVTGAARGIGRSAALALAGLGARVAVVDLSKRGREAADLIQREGGTAAFFRADVADEADVARLVNDVTERLGSATVVINNAILCPVAPVSEMSAALWDRVLGVNLRGPFLVTRAFLPGLLAARRGSIVNLVSTDAMPGLSAYIASKQGLVGFTRSLAAELGEGAIHTVAFAPGMVETPGLLTAAEDLAPLLGMTAAQFRTISLHTAYPGLMPVEHAGVAVAYLVARLAGECHGEVVTGYEVLERAGLIASAGGVEAGASVARPGVAAGQAPDCLQLCRRLVALLAETAADFERLPFFVRPMARAGFKGKAGRSLQAWQQAAEALQRSVEAGAPIDSARLVLELDRLISYVRGVPAETARFTRDAAMLREVQERMSGYESDLLALRQTLLES